MPQPAVELRRGERELAFIAGANDGGVWRLEVGTAIVPAHADFCLQLEFALDNLSSTKLLVCATFIRFVTRTIPSRGLLILQAEEVSSNFTSNAADAAQKKDVCALRDSRAVGTAQEALQEREKSNG